jgi:hypothetical protein
MERRPPLPIRSSPRDRPSRRSPYPWLLRGATAWNTRGSIQCGCERYSMRHTYALSRRPSPESLTFTSYKHHHPYIWLLDHRTHASPSSFINTPNPVDVGLLGCDAVWTYRSPRNIIRTLYWTLSWTSLIHSTLWNPHFSEINFNIILQSAPWPSLHIFV